MAGPVANNADKSRGTSPPGLPIFVVTFFLTIILEIIAEYIHAVTATLKSVSIMGITVTSDVEVELTAAQRKGDAGYSKDYPSWAGIASILNLITFWTLLIFGISVVCKASGCNCGDDCCGNSKGSWATYCCNCCACPAGIVYSAFVGLNAFLFLLSTIGLLISDGYYEPLMVHEYSPAFGWFLAIFVVVLWLVHLGYTVAVFMPASIKHWDAAGSSSGEGAVVGAPVAVAMVPMKGAPDNTA